MKYNNQQMSTHKNPHVEKDLKMLSIILFPNIAAPKNPTKENTNKEINVVINVDTCISFFLSTDGPYNSS